MTGKKIPNLHKRITLDVKSGVLRWFEACEKLRQLVEALEMASEVLRAGRWWEGREEASRLLGLLVPCALCRTSA